MLPKLQVALDNTSIEQAIIDIKEVGDIVDIIEIGTVLHLTHGMLPLRIIRNFYGEEKTIMSDMKVADAGKTLAQAAVDSGANQLTVICNADIETIEALKDVADPANVEVHVELYGFYSEETMKKWSDVGITNVVYHRSRDAQLRGKTWDQSDFDNIKRLNDFGFKVTVTGGLVVEDLILFKDFDVYCFIAGRSIRDSEDSRQAAIDFKEEIARIFS